MNDQPVPHVSMPYVAARPTAWKLLQSTLLAVVAAGVLLVTTVLPAEYGIDVTGIGRVLGLTQMGESKHRVYMQTLSDVSDILDRAAERQAIFSMQKKLEVMERDLAVIKSAIAQKKEVDIPQ